jgi:hypothetical protein
METAKGRDFLSSKIHLFRRASSGQLRPKEKITVLVLSTQFLDDFIG